MPRHFEQRTVPYTPEQMFALVADIRRYPEFLPWCLSADVQCIKNGIQKAYIIVGYKAFREAFTSIVTVKEQKSITVQYKSGPLSHLTNEWHFAPSANGGCDLTFFVDFGFHSSFLGSIMNMFFEKAFQKMVVAFEARAEHLYGKKE